jgi:two-component sensor histidine kinase
LSKSIEVEPPAEPSQTAVRSVVASPLILREFQHRMANTLAILGASLRKELAPFKDPCLREALKRHEKRIVAAADLHRFFSRHSGDGTISAEGYFQSLCGVLSRSVLAPLGLQCEAFVDKADMPAAKCELLGLAITELVLNAAKHAFPDNSYGRVRTDVLKRDHHWCCTVSDNGTGIRNEFNGSGSDIIAGLVDALEGQMAIRTGPEGTAVSIIFPGREGRR